MAPRPPLNVLAFAGSLRRASFNRALLKAAQKLSPPELNITAIGLGDLPLYDGDLDTDSARPGSVQEFKTAIAEADALLIATPEYNHSVSGVLQNAIDWASRPAFKSPLVGKPAAIMGASMSTIGTARAQQALKLVLASTLVHVMPHMGVAVAAAHQKFDAQGRLTDEATRQFLQMYLAEFSRYIRTLSAPTEEPSASAPA